MKFIVKKILLILLVLTFWACGASENGRQDGQSARTPRTSESVVSSLQQCADIATTELTVRKIAVYDTSKSERFTWTDPNTWKWGDQKCIIPVEVRIKYGYDLRDLRVSDVKISDDRSTVIIRRPKPKIVDAGYNLYIDKGSVVKMSTGFRSEVGHALEEEIRKKGYDAVMKEDFSGLVGEEIENNARTLFTSMLKAMGWENVVIWTHDGTEPK